MASNFEHIWSGIGIESLLLAPFGGLYALGWWTYQSMYGLGLKKPYEPHIPVVTVGNLIAGGAGKSPTALFVADVLNRMDREVVMSCSGYGFPRSVDATLAPDGELSAHEWGDEPAMVRMLRPELPLVVGRDRVMAAKIVHQSHPGAVMLMDDGFQHLRLKQHLTVLLDGVPANPFCLPAGPYREPRSSGRKRGGLVLPNDRMTLFRGGTVVQDRNGSLVSPQETNVLCALARPYRLTDTLVREGYVLRTVRNLPDHDPLTAGNLLTDFDRETPLLVTAKDWVKLRDRKDLEGRSVLIANYEVRIEPLAEFEAWLQQQLNGIDQQETSK